MTVTREEEGPQSKIIIRKKGSSKPTGHLQAKRNSSHVQDKNNHSLQKHLRVAHITSMFLGFNAFIRNI